MKTQKSFFEIILRSVLALLLGSFIAISPVFADPPPEVGVTLTPRANQTNEITNLKNRANNAIDARISNLNKLIDKINNIKRLTSDQKTSLTSQVQTEIRNLQALKAKIDADTDLTTLRSDIKSIVQSFRVYVVFIPKIYIIAHADRLIDIVSLLQTVENKLQARVTKAGNPANLTAFLTDMTNKLSDANTQAQNAINAVLPLTPEGWPGNKTVLQNARTMLVTARHDIQDAVQDVQKVREGLRDLGKTTAKPTPTP